MESFWKRLPKPFFVLAPMADVTDPAYRRLIAETHAPDVMWTEFVSADGLYYTREKGGIPDDENPLMRDLEYLESERPVVAQFFSSKPEMIEYASRLAAIHQFDGIDLNMGCPDKSIEKQGSGAAMIKTPELVKEIMMAARRGAAQGKANGDPLPVSIKTRIGYNHESINEWIGTLLKEKPDALTVHLRTRKEMSSVEAHWELMPKIIALRNELSPETLVIGNGDIKDLEDAHEKAATYGVDGVMLGRAIFGNPWLFSLRIPADISFEERLHALAKLARYFGELRPQKSFHILKKHVKAFVTGFEGAALLRQKLMEVESIEAMIGEIEELVPH